MKTKIAIILLLLIGIFVVNTLYQVGFFKSIQPHSMMTDHHMFTNMAGTEDIDVDRAGKRLFISSNDRWNQHEHGSLNDGIYLLDLDSDSQPVKMVSDFRSDFHPHGISFFGKNNDDYLFVVNHSQTGDFIELFKVEHDRLVHIKTIENEQMCCPNDVVAVDIDKFYVSNDHGAADGFARTLEDYLKLANSYVLYFDGAGFTKVYEHLNYANGVNASADGKTIYVTEVSTGRLSVLDRDIASGQLNLRFTKMLGTGIDNITLDVDGNLWLAAHPKLLDFVGHAKNTGNLSPSQVLRLSPDGEYDFEVTEVYMNAGEELSGSSTALYHDGQVYVGVVFENKFLRGKYH